MAVQGVMVVQDAAAAQVVLDIQPLVCQDGAATDL
jgi:hypothetical protein